MSEANSMDLISGLLVLILPISALVARRLPIGSVLKMALAWTAIFGVMMILVGQRERLRPMWDEVAGLLRDNVQQVQGGTLRLTMQEDGHFWVDARVNGVTTRMMIDSGASTTALSQATAEAAKVPLDRDPFGAGIDTANGRVVATRATVENLALGPINATQLPVVVSAAFGDTDVIGMNFLSRLKGWRVEGRTMILEPDTL